MDAEHYKTVGKGFLGIFSSIGGIAVSMQAVEAWLRVGSLVIGIAVGVLTFVSIWKKL